MEDHNHAEKYLKLPTLSVTHSELQRLLQNVQGDRPSADVACRMSRIGEKEPILETEVLVGIVIAG